MIRRCPAINHIDKNSRSFRITFQIFELIFLDFWADGVCPSHSLSKQNRNMEFQTTQIQGDVRKKCIIFHAFLLRYLMNLVKKCGCHVNDDIPISHGYRIIRDASWTQLVMWTEKCLFTNIFRWSMKLTVLNTFYTTRM